MQHGVVWSKVLEFVIYFLIVSPPNAHHVLAHILPPSMNRIEPQTIGPLYATPLVFPYPTAIHKSIDFTAEYLIEVTPLVVDENAT